jgi:hypothetical protein
MADLYRYIENWSKYETNNPTAEIGNNFSDVGTITNPAVKFGNGVYATTNNNYITASITDSPRDLFMYSFWIDTDYNVTNGIPASAMGDVFSVFKSNTIKTGMYIDNSLGFYIFDTVVSGGIDLAVTTGLTWTAGNPQYMQVLFSRNNVMSSSHTFRLYHNGVLRGSTSKTASLNLVGAGSKLALDNGKLYALPADATLIDEIIDLDYKNSVNEGHKIDNKVISY